MLHKYKFKLCNLILHLIVKTSTIKQSESKIIIVYKNEHLNLGPKINHISINMILKWGQNQHEMLHRKSDGREAQYINVISKEQTKTNSIINILLF